MAGNHDLGPTLLAMDLGTSLPGPLWTRFFVLKHGINNRMGSQWRMLAFPLQCPESSAPELGRASHGWSTRSREMAQKGHRSSQVPRLGPGCDGITTTSPLPLLLPALPGPSLLP